MDEGTTNTTTQITMANSFLDEAIPKDQFFIHMPHCRTRRQICAEYIRTSKLAEKQPTRDEADRILHRIFDPFSMDEFIYRQVVLQPNQLIKKSVRIGHSNLEAEKDTLELIMRKTRIPVPRVHQYYRSAEFEHLMIDRILGITLEKAWPTLLLGEREAIADQVAHFIYELRQMQSPTVQAAILHRQPLRVGIADATDLSLEKFKDLIFTPQIAAYVQDRSSAFQGQPNVFTHGDLDWSNIMVVDGQVSGIIDWELAGYFPPYWEWVRVKDITNQIPDGEDTWFHLLERRLAISKTAGWDGMLEVEELYDAVHSYATGYLEPQHREDSRAMSWSRVTEILGARAGDPPPISYASSSKHLFWLDWAEGKQAHEHEAD